MAEQIKEREEMMRDRLTRLIDGFVFGTQIAVNSIEWNSAKVKELADYLIANGVIVPPCKVGDTVWRINRTFEEYPDKSKPYIEPDAFLLQDVFNIGKTVFFTREEAEKALQEMEGKE